MDWQELEGLWTYVANEVGGVKWTPEQISTMAQLALLVGDYLPGWDGLWAVITYGYERGTWTEVEVKASCRHIILGTDRKGDAPASDFYLWAGGRFRVASGRFSQEIDLEQYWKGSALPSMTLGIYKLAGERLTLCLSEAGKPRPSRFGSDEDPSQSLSELVREGIRRTNRST